MQYLAPLHDWSYFCPSQTSSGIVLLLCLSLSCPGTVAPLLPAWPLAIPPRSSWEGHPGSKLLVATLAPLHPPRLAQYLALHKCSPDLEASLPGPVPLSPWPPRSTELPPLHLVSRCPWRSKARPLSPDSMRPLREASVARVQEISIRFSCSCSWLSESWGTSTRSPSPTGTTFCILKRHRHTDMEWGDRDGPTG